MYNISDLLIKVVNHFMSINDVWFKLKLELSYQTYFYLNLYSLKCIYIILYIKWYIGILSELYMSSDWWICNA